MTIEVKASGGGGLPIGSMVALMQTGPVVEEGGSTFLRTGMVETDLSKYPDAPVGMYRTFTSHTTNTFTTGGIGKGTYYGYSIVKESTKFNYYDANAVYLGAGNITLPSGATSAQQSCETATKQLILFNDGIVGEYTTGFTSSPTIKTLAGFTGTLAKCVTIGNKFFAVGSDNIVYEWDTTSWSSNPAPVNSWSLTEGISASAISELDGNLIIFSATHKVFYKFSPLGVDLGSMATLTAPNYIADIGGFAAISETEMFNWSFYQSASETFGLFSACVGSPTQTYLPAGKSPSYTNNSTGGSMYTESFYIKVA